MKKIGILSYGSIISDPGSEIVAATVGVTEQVQTPFNIEYARSSRGRSGAPTLVPVRSGGVSVLATIFHVDVSEAGAANILYRREINKVGSTSLYKAKASSPDAVKVARLENFSGYDVVLYTDISANIELPTAEKLADLAIESAKREKTGRDGISYLIAANINGITTPLSKAYEAEIIRKIGKSDLASALIAIQRPL